MAKRETIKDDEIISELIAKDTKSVKIDVEDITTDTKVNLTDDTLVCVRSNRLGKLIYKDKTGNKVIWDKLGSTQELTLREIRDIKTTQPKFFSEQFVVLTEIVNQENYNAKLADVYKVLNLSKFYSAFIDPVDYLSFTTMKSSELKGRLALLSKGARDNLIVALNTYIRAGLIDSYKKIRELETILQCKLIKP